MSPCPLSQDCANYATYSFNCNFLYGGCQIRKDIERARHQIMLELNCEKIRDSRKGLDSFADTPEREGATL